MQGDPQPFLTRAFPWLLALLLAISLVHDLQSPPLQDYRETRYAEQGREILEGRDWLIPTLNGTPFLNKPPLLTWLVAASFESFGIGETQARVPAVLATLWTAAIVGWMTRRIFGRGKGLLGAVLFLGAPATQYYGRVLMSDVLAVAFVVSAVAAFLKGYLEDKANWYRLGFAACGLAVLSRGPVGLLYPLGSLLLFGLLTDRRGMRGLPWFTGALLFLVVTAPWFAWVELEHPGFLRHHFILQQVERIVSGGSQPFVALPRWQILLGFAGLLGPMALLLPWSIGGVRGEKATHRLLWILAFLVLGSVLVSSGRNHTYTLPAIPPLACLAAGWLGGLTPHSPSLMRRAPALLIALFGAAVLGSLAWAGEILGNVSPLLAESGTTRIAQESLVVVGFLALLGGLFLMRGLTVGACLALGAIMLPGSWMLLHLEERLAPLESRASVARWVARETPSQWPLVVADPRDRQFEGTGGWGFYARRKVLMVSFEPQGRHVGQAMSRPDWVIPVDGLMDMVISGRPLVLAATQEALSRLSLGTLPHPEAKDARFSVWVLRPLATPEGDPPPGPASRKEPVSP